METPLRAPLSRGATQLPASSIPPSVTLSRLSRLRPSLCAPTCSLRPSVACQSAWTRWAQSWSEDYARIPLYLAQPPAVRPDWATQADCRGNGERRHRSLPCSRSKKKRGAGCAKASRHAHSGIPCGRVSLIRSIPRHFAHRPVFQLLVSGAADDLESEAGGRHVTDMESTVSTTPQTTHRHKQ
jgi:hypothetical protein